MLGSPAAGWQTNLMADDGKRIAIICGTCGSDEVSRDAWANWDTRSQQWVLGAVFDYGHCHRCDGESRLIEVDLTPERQD
jgi:hypothetical protein